MKILRTSTTVLRNGAGKVLKLQDDNYVEVDPDAFMVEIAVEDNQIFTLPTNIQNVTTSYIDLYMSLHSSYNGPELAANDNSGGNSQPQITFSCAANTEYYLKVVGADNNQDDIFGVQVTGPTGGVPSVESGVTNVTVGTTGINNQIMIPNGTSWFKFKSSSAGTYTMKTLQGVVPYNYNIDWGDGTIVSNITTYNSASRVHTYVTAGTYIIKITGSLPCWTVNDNAAIKLLITRCISWGNVGLRLINFHGCTALTTLPQQQGKLKYVTTFASFCKGCTSLISIPYGTFFNSIKATSFSEAFMTNTSLRTIPQTTFRDTSMVTSFYGTFMGCNKLTVLPGKLFENCWRVTAWQYCFRDCTALISLPADLFYRAKMDGTQEDYDSIAVSSMNGCFYQCNQLKSVPSGLFSSPQLDDLGRNTVKGLDFSQTFYYCSALGTDVGVEGLPKYLFHNQNKYNDINNDFQSFIATFSGCTGLKKVPEGCFDGCTRAKWFGTTSQYYNYSGVFSNCTGITTIENYAFRDTIAAITFNFAFYNCSSLTTLCPEIFHDCPEVLYFQGTFALTKISSWNADPDTSKYQLDPDIFRYNTKVITFEDTFISCTNLKDIPEDLFRYCTAVTTFKSTFSSCTYITAIPPKLFRYNPAVNNFDGTFNNCTRIEGIPTMIDNYIEYGLFYFNPLVTSFNSTFAGIGNASTITEITIPVITFNGNTQATIFTSTFRTIQKLKVIPDYLFQYNINVTTFANIFADCTNVALSSIPSHLFYNNENVADFSGAFQNTRIKSIPELLFSYSPRVSTFNATFASTSLETQVIDGNTVYPIPSNLFNVPGSSVQDFTRVFYGCTLLTSIPSNLFDTNINSQLFIEAFRGCTLMANVPSDLFKFNTKVTSFLGIFRDNSNLTTVPSLLFNYNTLALNFTDAFNGCVKLTLNDSIFCNPADKSTRFLDKLITFTSCFYRVSWSGGSQGTAPDLWNYTFNFIPTKTSCWGGAGNSTTSLSNYASIPSGWK